MNKKPNSLPSAVAEARICTNSDDTFVCPTCIKLHVGCCGFTHKGLVEVAYKWLLNNTSCGVAFKELVSLTTNEIADVIGFGSGGHSVLIEVKISRSDFLSDKKKIFRQYPEMGMGTQRFYCCPTDLIKQSDLPNGWGLIYVNDKMKARCVFQPYKGNIGERHDGFAKNIKAEHGLMYSALRRLHCLRLKVDSSIVDDIKSTVDAD